MKILAEGAEAIVYKTELDGFKVLVKRRIRKEYRIPEMDTQIRAIRSRKEAKIMATVSKAGINSPRLVLYDGYDLYMTQIVGEKLSHLMERGRIEKGTFREVGEMLGALHGAGIAHGDYTPANILVSGDGPCVIDFGLSEFTGSAEEKALDILLMKRAIPKANYLEFVEGYKTSSNSAKETLKRLDAIERRGRYQTRTLT